MCDDLSHSNLTERKNKMNSKKIVVNNSFIVNTLRNCGYTSYTAIADIIDNSIEQDVRVEKDCTPFVKVMTSGKKPNGPIDRLLVIDNGTGMDFDTLTEAMSLGSNTGKDPAFDLGCYGTGLKTAAFSIGQVLDVYTKEAENDLYRATISLKDSLENGTDVEVKFNTIEQNSAEYTFFEKTVGYDTANLLHGTIVAISEIDRIVDNCEQFAGHLNYEIADTFNQFIRKHVVDFYVNGKKCLYTDFIDSGEEIASGTAIVKNADIAFKCYDLINANYHERARDSYGHYLLDDTADHYTINTSALNAGIYIYRQNRLVGKALKLGLTGMGDGYTQRFRCELFIDGNSDVLFNTAFTKMISEKEKDSMCEEMRSFLDNRIYKYVKQISDDAHARVKAAKQDDPEEAKILARVKNSANKNNTLRIQRTNVINKKHPDQQPVEHQYRGPQKNPNPTRIRNDKWLAGITAEHLGKDENFFLITRSEKNNRELYSVKINADHVFYTEFFNKLDDSAKYRYGQILVCETLARENLNYWRDDDVKNRFDLYDEFLTTELKKVL